MKVRKEGKIKAKTKVSKRKEKEKKGPKKKF